MPRYDHKKALLIQYEHDIPSATVAVWRRKDWIPAKYFKVREKPWSYQGYPITSWCKVYETNLSGLALQIGVDIKNVWAWANGMNKPSKDSLEKLDTYFRRQRIFRNLTPLQEQQLLMQVEVKKKKRLKCRIKQSNATGK